MRLARSCPGLTSSAVAQVEEAQHLTKPPKDMMISECAPNAARRLSGFFLNLPLVAT